MDEVDLVFRVDVVFRVDLAFGRLRPQKIIKKPKGVGHREAGTLILCMEEIWKEKRLGVSTVSSWMEIKRKGRNIVKPSPGRGRGTTAGGG